MASQLIQGGAYLEIPSRQEIGQELAAALAQDRADREHYRGVKYMRFPVLSGTVSGGALTVGGHTSLDIIGPEMGDAWVVRHLWIKGLTGGSTPDAVNVIVNNQTWWQLNGNNFAQTWSKGEIVLLQGEAFAFQNSGSLSATGQILIGGAYWRVPGEMLAKLY